MYSTRMVVPQVASRSCAGSVLATTFLSSAPASLTFFVSIGRFARVAACCVRTTTAFTFLAHDRPRAAPSLLGPEPVSRKGCLRYRNDSWPLSRSSPPPSHPVYPRRYDSPASPKEGASTIRIAPSSVNLKNLFSVRGKTRYCERVKTAPFQQWRKMTADIGIDKGIGQRRNGADNKFSASRKSGITAKRTTGHHQKIFRAVITRFRPRFFPASAYPRPPTYLSL